MASFWHKSVRCAILGVMILLTGIAPLLTVSVDNDDDDETPPITVELNLAAPTRKTIQVSAAEVSRQVTATGSREPFAKAALRSPHHPNTEVAMVSPQLVVPLRT